MPTTRRTFLNKSLTALGAVLAGAVDLTAMPAKAEHDCKPTVTERLNRLNVDPSDVRKIDWVEVIKVGGDDEFVKRIDAWVSLRSCKGYVVIQMTPHCFVSQVYGRGECASVVP